MNEKIKDTGIDLNSNLFILEDKLKGGVDIKHDKGGGGKR